MAHVHPRSSLCVYLSLTAIYTKQPLESFYQCTSTNVLVKALAVYRNGGGISCIIIACKTLARIPGQGFKTHH